MDKFDFKFEIENLINYPMLSEKPLTIMEKSIVMKSDGIVDRSYRVRGNAIDTWVNATVLEKEGKLVN